MKYLFCLFAFSVLMSLGCKEKVVVGRDPFIDPDVKPEVLFTIPADSAIGPFRNNSYFTGPVEVIFNKYMDPNSVRQAIRLINPEYGVRIEEDSMQAKAWNHYLVMFRNSEYNPLHWEIGKMYTLEIGTAARDVNEHYLSSPVHVTFTPEPYFRVVSLQSQILDGKVVGDASLEICFNSQVDASIFQYIMFTPTVSGTWRFTSWDSLRVLFTQPQWRHNRTYTVSVVQPAHDKEGRTLGLSYDTTFSTSPFTVTEVSPNDGSTNVPLSTPVQVTLNGLVDSFSVEQAVNILPLPVIPPTFAFGKYSFAINFPQQLEAGVSYRVTLEKSLQTLRQDSIVRPYSFSFITVPFKIVSTTPSHNQTNVPPSTFITLRCNAFVDTTTVRSAISITPSMEHIFGYRNDVPELILAPVPGRALQPNTTYTVSIDTTLRSRAGAKLLTGASFTFTTGN